ncbi:limbic system-associated membrane protein-like [Ptychodera flava]|uniref:limbic system-associated membrane protein-like n=1 Tax=Ptychodera flava TaxID=63121 RepID=UPI00396A5DD1
METIVFLLLAAGAISVYGEVLPFTSNITIAASENAELVCRTTGIPDYSSSVIYWVRSSDSRTITYKNELAYNGDDPDEPGEIPRYSMDLQTPNEYTLKITDAKYLDSGKWVCTSGNSEAVWLTVEVTPEITYITEDFFAKANTTKRLRCTATGNPTPVITWTRYENTLPGGDVMFHGSELELVNMTSSDRGTYQCVAMSAVGTASAMVKVTMNHKPVITIMTPVVSAPINGTATLVCEYAAYPPVNDAIWLRNGIPVVGFNVEIRTNTKVSSIVFREIRPNQYGEYECRVHNQEGTVTKTIQFIEEPIVTITTLVVRAPINGIAILVCEYEAYPPVNEVTWLHDGMHVGESGDFEVTILTNSTKSFLFFGKVTSSQYGQYECRVSNLEGTAIKILQFIEAQQETTPSPEEVSQATTITASAVIMLMGFFTATKLYFARKF